MARYLDQLKELQKSLGDPPVICVGDVFDSYNVPPELINHALAILPTMYAVPGQHDLPHHRLQDLHRSAYWTLVEAGRVKHLDQDGLWNLNGVAVYPFAWGSSIVARNNAQPTADYHLAVAHAYVWLVEKHPKADRYNQAEEYAGRLKGYDGAVFGDNHKAFMSRLKTGTVVVNNGGFFVRKSDEIGYRPRVSVLGNDLKWRFEYLDTSGDRFTTTAEVLAAVQTGVDISGFVAELVKVAEGSENFKAAVLGYLDRNNVGPRTRDAVLRALEGEK
jgi:hypothetical protein